MNESFVQADQGESEGIDTTRVYLPTTSFHGM